jgi:hypothetical protein
MRGTKTNARGKGQNKIKTEVKAALQKMENEK